MTRASNEPRSWPRVNVRVLSVFAPVLVLTGVLGFLVPADKSLMSGATPYNVFHIVFGVIGAACLLSPARARAASIFVLGFGAIDLWQAVAGLTGLPPATWFALRPADHVLHVLIGGALAYIGAQGLRHDA